MRRLRQIVSELETFESAQENARERAVPVRGVRESVKNEDVQSESHGECPLEARHQMPDMFETDEALQPSYQTYVRGPRDHA